MRYRVDNLEKDFQSLSLRLLQAANLALTQSEQIKMLIQQLQNDSERIRRLEALHHDDGK